MKIVQRICFGAITILGFTLTLAIPGMSQTWTQLSPLTPPSPGIGPGRYDPATNRMIVFGGDTSCCYSNEVWVLTNANGLGGTPQWLQLAPIPDPSYGFPSPRQPWTAYDAIHNRLIIMDGCLGNCLPVATDQWVLTNANGLGGTPAWFRLSPVGSPGPRVDQVMAYDPATNTLIVFGGQNGCCANIQTYSDAWVLSNANGLGGTPVWTQLQPTGGPPPGQDGTAGVYDSVNNRLIVTGGSPYQSDTISTNAVWVLSNANGHGGTPVWTNIVPEGAAGSPPGRGFGAAVYDPGSNSMILFGGRNSASYLNDTWLLSNANGIGGTPVWTQLNPTGGPPAGRFYFAGVFDPASDRMTIFGGASAAPPGSLNDTWVLAGAVPQGPSTLFFDDFNSYAPGSSLAGQGGWYQSSVYTAPLILSSSTPLGTVAIDGTIRTGTGQYNGTSFAVVGHALPPLNPNSITVVSANAYAYNGYMSHDAGIFIGNSDLSFILAAQALWYASHSPTWAFFGSPVGSNDLFSGAFDQPVLLQMIIDGVAGQYYFRMTHSGGTYESPHHPITPAQIAQLTDVYVEEDYRDIYLGIAIDNFKVTSTGTAAQLTITASANKADGTAYTAGTWTNQTVTVRFTCTEFGPGVPTCPANQIFSSDGVTPTASGTATDTLGNSATANFGPIKIDKTPPAITASATNADNSPYIAGTWTNQSVTLHFACSDSGSGVATCAADQVFILGGVTPSASGTATDNAGNMANATFGPIQINKPPPVQPTLASATFYGGPGDQYGYGIAIQNGHILLGTQPAQVVQYAIPPGAPTASGSFNGFFGDLTTVGSVVYGVGAAVPSACGAVDGVGDTEGKTVLARYDSASLSLLGCQSYNFFPYRGGEAYLSIVNVPPYLYALGTAETCGFTNNSLILSKFDVSGNLLTTVGEPGVSFSGFSCIGNSNGYRMALLNSNLYTVGFSRLSSEDGINRPVVMKYGLDLTRQWKARPTDNSGGAFWGVTASGGAIYAAGFAVVNGTNDFLIEKYDESGNRIWSKSSGGPGDDELENVVAIGSRLYAVGFTTSQGAGGRDIVILEIDPSTGNTISTTLYGGANDDVAQSAATDGVDLYVVGTSNSFATPAGNLVGQNDVVLLRYAVGSGGVAAPTAAPTQLPLANPAGWNNTDVVVTWNWTEYAGGPGIDNSHCTTSTTSSGEGSIPLTATCNDLAGNTGQASYTVKVDKTMPVITASATKADSTAYTPGTWTNQTITVHFTCSDSGSGVATCPANQTYSADGVTPSASGTATDNAGNTASASFGSIQIDKAPPLIAASATKADSTAYTAGTWTNQTVTVHFTCSDSGSGVATCPANQIFSASGVTPSTGGTATDNAGNTASASFGPIQIDKTPPLITASATKADSTAYTAGTWTNQTVTVHFTCSDSGSGVATCPVNQIYSAEGVTPIASGTGTDNVGNGALANFGPIQIDKTPPTLLPVVSPNPVALNAVASASAGGADALSGAASQSCGAVATTPIGTHSVTCTVTDNAGNTSSASTNYLVTANGGGNVTVQSGQTYTFVNGSITGNLTMTGGTVVLNNTSVTGNLQMSAGSLVLTGGSSVSGNVQINGGGAFNIGPGTTIGGNLQIQSIPSSAGPSQVCGATVTNDLVFQNNGAAVLIGSVSPPCAGNTIGGNLTVQNNAGATSVDNNSIHGNLADHNNSGPTQVFGNTITGNLQCSINSSITGGGNTAASKQGQCTAF